MNSKRISQRFFVRIANNGIRVGGEGSKGYNFNSCRTGFQQLLEDVQVEKVRGVIIGSGYHMNMCIIQVRFEGLEF